jgi:hypothetical protein
MDLFNNESVNKWPRTDALVLLHLVAQAQPDKHASRNSV